VIFSTLVFTHKTFQTYETPGGRANDKEIDSAIGPREPPEPSSAILGRTKPDLIAIPLNHEKTPEPLNKYEFNREPQGKTRSLRAELFCEQLIRLSS